MQTKQDKVRTKPRTSQTKNKVQTNKQVKLINKVQELNQDNQTKPGQIKLYKKVKSIQNKCKLNKQGAGTNSNKCRTKSTSVKLTQTRSE
ncbi:hypothetical protein HYD43_03905 [Mycoplasmopsis bovis]|nr:hypothetical protein [Mycoplasmopsis bovis]QQH84079.1 hypothetical protein HYD43_03905 [Mycoplasmopsis bovis]